MVQNREWLAAMCWNSFAAVFALAFLGAHATVGIAQDAACSRCGLIRHPRTITLREMWNRDHSDGIEHGHLAYQSTGTYYYHRPYNSAHYHQHRLRFQQRAGVEPLSQETLSDRQFVEGFQYADNKEKHLFNPLVREADDSTDRVKRPEDSGVLEFADWRRHEFARSQWAKTQTQAKAKETRQGPSVSSSAKIVSSRSE